VCLKQGVSLILGHGVFQNRTNTFKYVIRTSENTPKTSHSSTTKFQDIFPDPLQRSIYVASAHVMYMTAVQYVRNSNNR